MPIEQFIEKFASQFEDSETENIQKDTDFKQLETWDSLTAFSVQMMIEDDYNVQLSPDDFKLVNTVGDLYNLIVSKSA